MASYMEMDLKWENNVVVCIGQYLSRSVCVLRSEEDSHITLYKCLRTETLWCIPLLECLNKRFFDTKGTHGFLTATENNWVNTSGCARCKRIVVVENVLIFCWEWYGGIREYLKMSLKPLLKYITTTLFNRTLIPNNWRRSKSMQ